VDMSTQTNIKKQNITWLRRNCEHTLTCDPKCK